VPEALCNFEQGKKEIKNKERNDKGDGIISEYKRIYKDNGQKENEFTESQ
jgi:hypothetical protein